MFRIENTVVDDALAAAPFCCDLRACAGACCTLEGGRGAPLEDGEIVLIAEHYPLIKEYLDPRNIAVIDREGLVEGSPGGFATTCIDRRECVFVYVDGGIARCGFERAFLEGRSTWRKPLSCHLFPVRVGNVGWTFVRYEEISECRPGRERGERERVQLHHFLRDALIRKFGQEWYTQLLERCAGEPQS
jgi:hypothetical protein